MLLSLFICLMIIFNTYSLIRLTHVNKIDSNEDVEIGMKQLSQYLLSSDIIDVNNKISYKNNGDTFTIEFDKNRIVKRPGYEIIVDNVEHGSFYVDNDYIYIKFNRNNKSNTYLIGEKYEKNNEE